MTPKRTIQAALLPYIFEQVLDLIEADSAHGVRQPQSAAERAELEAHLPIIRAAYAKALESRRAIIPDAQERLRKRLAREYRDEFQAPLLQRTTGYGLLVAVYLAHIAQQCGMEIPEGTIEAANSVTRIAQSGSNADAIDGMQKSAWRKAIKIYDRLHRLGYVPALDAAAAE